MKLEVVNDGDRLDKYLNLNTDYSRSKIQSLIEDGDVLVNNEVKRSSYKVKNGDVIEITIKEEDISNLEKENIPLDILYEDKYLAVINKQSGLVTHPAVGNYNHTLVNALLYHFNISDKDNVRPGIVHRLDKDTSGVMVVAKDEKTHELLSLMIKNKEVERKYLALVWGVIKCDRGKIDAPIGRDINNRQKYVVTDINSKEAITNFEVVKRFNNATLIMCKLDTGRTHQIRVHLNYIGYPVVNDLVYGNRKIIDKDFGQMLHSVSIKFKHPITNEELYFTKDVPERFNEIMNMFVDK